MILRQNTGTNENDLQIRVHLFTSCNAAFYQPGSRKLRVEGVVRVLEVTHLADRITLTTLE
jgi:hypothetical protein